MTEKPLDRGDYPLAERRPELVRGQRGKALEEITLEAICSGQVEMEDLRITLGALRHQAEIARAAGRGALADNFERAAEMTAVPQAVVMEVYEILRPGRATGKGALLAMARRLRETYGADNLAGFVTEAAEVYERRGLFTSRF